jgi:septal ring factor EnvC (AmiA/AmiB activator)
MRPLVRAALAIPLLVAPALLVAASAPVRTAADPLQTRIAEAAAEAAAAEARVERLEQQAEAAKDEAARLRARQAAAAEAIAAAEARISAADSRARLIAALMQARRERLQREQAPAGALLAGLAMMASRPPLIAILDEGSTREFVRVRVLLDSTLPEIHRRTAALRDEIERGRALAQAASAARAAMARNRSELAARQQQFAELEAEALRLAELRTGQALGAGDIALARSEQAGQLSRQARGSRAASQIAAELASLPPPPPRPLGPSGERPGPEPPAYRLPAAAQVTEGLGAVAPNGIRARGLTMATARGTRLVVPASGIVRFAGPFRSYDGIVIIDHGGGWMSLILNLSSPLEAGARVRIGEPLGRALGPIGVELSHKGTHVSAALIAGSSQALSNKRERG